MAAGGTILIKNMPGLTPEATAAIAEYCRLAGLDRPRLPLRPGERPHLPPPWDRVTQLHIPPLRERKADIPDLARAFLRELNAVYGATDQPISSEAMRMLVAYPYLSANIAELYGVISHAAHLASGEQIRPEHLHLGARGPHPGRPVVGLALVGAVFAGSLPLEELERLAPTLSWPKLVGPICRRLACSATPSLGALSSR